MNEPENTTPSQMKHPKFERDPFPKMIVVCIVISMVLFMFIGAVLAWDLSREHETPGDDLAPPSMPVIVHESPGTPADDSRDLP